MVRLVFTADNHLSKYYALMTPDQLMRRRERLRRAWIETVEFALNSGADLYLHGGDLFDTYTPRPADLIAVARQLRRLNEAGIPIHLIGGNHDVPKSRADGSTPQRLYAEAGMAHIFDRVTAVEWYTHDIRGTRVAIGGLPFDPRLEVDADPLDGVDDLEPPADADFAVLMLHYAVEGMLPGDVAEPILSKARIASLRGVDLLLLGHVHERKVMDIGNVKVAYSGPTERMSFGERAVAVGFVEVSLGSKGVTVRHHDTHPQPMQRDVLKTTDQPADASAALRDHINARSHPDQLYQLRLEGPLDMDGYRAMRWAELRALGTESNFYFHLDTRLVYLTQRRQTPVGAGGERVSPREEIEAIAASLAQQATDDEERDLIEAARRLILHSL